MDPRILDLYNDELEHLRSETAEFAREYPDAAKRLSLDEKKVEDPYVERLLEGVAFLAARVRLKLESQYPIFTQQLLEVLFPTWSAPTPSAAVFQLRADTAQADLAKGVPVPRGTVVVGSLRGNPDARCEFQTTAASTLWPLEIRNAQYFAARPEARLVANLNERPASSLRVEIAVAGDAVLAKLPIDRLRFFLTQGDAFGSQLMELMAGRCVGVALSTDAAGRGNTAWLDASQVQHAGFGMDEAMLPLPPRGHTGFRVLKEYAALPEKFRFVEVSGLAAGLPKMPGQTLFLHFFFSGVFPRLEGAVKQASLALHCVPAVNLRERVLDRIDIKPGMTEFHLIGDRMRPRNLEVHQVIGVKGGGGGNERAFSAMYETVASGRLGAASHYIVRRERRMLTKAEQQGRTVTYPGSEVYLSLVEPAAPPYGKDLQYLSVRALCSNRDVPLFLKAQFSDAQYLLVDSLPVSRVDCVAGPSVPLSSPVDGFEPWEGLSHLFVNHLSLFESAASQSGQGAEALRAMLGLYGSQHTGHFLRRQAEGLLSVAAEQVTRRVPRGGPITFGRGVEVTLTMTDRAFDGGSPYMLGAVLEQYLAAHVSINSFVVTRLNLVDRAEHIAWPTRTGCRPTF